MEAKTRAKGKEGKKERERKTGIEKKTQGRRDRVRKREREKQVFITNRSDAKTTAFPKTGELQRLLGEVQLGREIDKKSTVGG